MQNRMSRYIRKGPDVPFGEDVYGKCEPTCWKDAISSNTFPWTNARMFKYCAGILSPPCAIPDLSKVVLLLMKCLTIFRVCLSKSMYCCKVYL